MLTLWFFRPLALIPKWFIGVVLPGSLEQETEKQRVQIWILTTVQLKMAMFWLITKVILLRKCPVLLSPLPWSQVLCCTLFAPLQQGQEGISQRCAAHTVWGDWSRGAWIREVLGSFLGAAGGIKIQDMQMKSSAQLLAQLAVLPSFCLQALGFIRETSVHLSCRNATALLGPSTFFKIHLKYK